MVVGDPDMLSSTDMDRRVAVPHNTEGFRDMFLHSFLEFSGSTNMGAGEVTSFFFAGCLRSWVLLEVTRIYGEPS